MCVCVSNVLFNHFLKKECNPIICSKMDGAGGHHSYQINKLDTRKKSSTFVIK